LLKIGSASVKIMKLLNQAIFLLILLTAIVLRIFDLTAIPFTYDEFSALYRTRFDSFSELIQKGVVVDTLPAGIQVFLYYWTRLFGMVEWIVKLPFIIFGILSVYLVYRIGKEWYNETVALISSAFLASLQYTVIYSQIARPYSSGLFLSLLLVFFWTRLVKNPEKRFVFNGIMFSITAAACAYNHHFSLLFAVIAGVSGLFFLPKKYIIKYLYFCLLACILYLPHLPVILAQLKLKGNEGWLGSIDNDFIIKYIQYIFQYSIPAYILVILFIIIGFKYHEVNKMAYKNLLISGTWFLLLFIIGFLYSKYINNVMQYSVLIFSFPFLLFILFGQFKSLKPIANLVIVSVILIVNIYSLIFIRKHYSVFYESQYVHILTDRVEANKKHPGIPAIIDSDRWISRFYSEKLNLDTNYTRFKTISNEKALRSYLEDVSQTSDYLYLGCLSSNPPYTVPVIHEFFKSTEVQRNYAGGTTFIFSKNGENWDEVIDYNDFSDPEGKYWAGLKKEFIHVDENGNKAYLIGSQVEWQIQYERLFDEQLDPQENDFIDVSVRFRNLDPLKEVRLYTNLNKDGKAFYNSSTRFDNYFSSDPDSGEWFTVHQSIKLSDVDLPSGKITFKTGIWNKGRSEFLVDDFVITLRKGNPVIYGWVEKIEN